MIIASRGETLFTVAYHGMGGQSDDGCRVASLAQNPCTGISVEDGHLHVHENRVERLVSVGCQHTVDRFSAVGGNLHFRAVFAQYETVQLLILRAVFGEQDAAS